MTSEQGDSDLERSGGEHDPHFEPIITLPEVAIPTLEEEEEELLKLRAKLFRYDRNENPPEWKERGTGDVKLLRHIQKNSVRVVMRRDKTLKLCANHFVTPWMELKPSMSSDRAWVYSVDADFADGELRKELLAIKFANAENAKSWKSKFEEAIEIVKTQCELYANGKANESRDSSDESEDEDDQEKDEDDQENDEHQNSSKNEEITLNDTDKDKEQEDKNTTDNLSTKLVQLKVNVTESEKK